MDLLPLLLIFAVMMLPLLFMSNRQKKMQQKQQELVRQLGVGDEVRTHSGFFGLIVETYDDVVVLESEDGTQTKWARQAIAQQVEETAPGQEDVASEQGEDADGSEGGPERSANGEIPGVTTADEPSRGEDPRTDLR